LNKETKNGGKSNNKRKTIARGRRTTDFFYQAAGKTGNLTGLIYVLTIKNGLPATVFHIKVKVPLSKKTLAGRNGCTKRF
jgi:hypothetical protein